MHKTKNGDPHRSGLKYKYQGNIGKQECSVEPQDLTFCWYVLLATVTYGGINLIQSDQPTKYSQIPTKPRQVKYTETQRERVPRFAKVKPTRN
jgi:hypothetical protein